MSSKDQNPHSIRNRLIVAECPEFATIEVCGHRYTMPQGDTLEAQKRTKFRINASESTVSNPQDRTQRSEVIQSLYECAKEKRERKIETVWMCQQILRALDATPIDSPFEPEVDQIFRYAREMMNFLDVYGSLLVKTVEGELEIDDFKNSLASAIASARKAYNQKLTDSSALSTAHLAQKRILEAIEIARRAFHTKQVRPSKQLIRSILQSMQLGYSGVNKEQTWREFWVLCGLENLPEKDESAATHPSNTAT
jgi:hypothetical protein